MTNKPRVVFFGTSDRSQVILESLDNCCNLVGCVTKPDTVVGRNKSLRVNGVKQWCLKRSMRFVEIENLKGNNLATYQEFVGDTKPYLGVMADFSIILTEQVIASIAKGIINIHFSKLPRYRGAAPVQAAILHGDSDTGVSFTTTVREMDKGDIIHFLPYTMNGQETSGELYSKLFQAAATELPFVIDGFLAGTLVPIKQDEDLASYTYSPSHPNNTYIYKEDAQILPGDTDIQIDRKVRAYNPWPIAWAYLADFEYIINRSVTDKIRFKSPLKDQKIKLYATELEEGRIKFSSIQLEGKNITTFKDFLNGYATK